MVRYIQEVVMYKITVKQNGIITLPAALRKKLHLITGSKLLVETRGNGIFMMPADFGYISRMKGSIKAGGSVSEFLLRERKKDTAIMEAKWSRH